MYTILLVEIDSLTRSAVSHTLDAMGLVVLPVATATEALLALGGVRFDVVIFGLAGQQDTGLDLVRRLDGAQSGVKFVVLSGSPPSLALRAVVEAHVQKPFTQTTLERTVRAVLNMPPISDESPGLPVPSD